eukprot:10125205-Alexandrium_andersonii.AAC.1
MSAVGLAAAALSDPPPASMRCVHDEGRWLQVACVLICSCCCAMPWLHAVCTPCRIGIGAREC